jgi:hypothetical protein
MHTLMFSMTSQMRTKSPFLRILVGPKLRRLDSLAMAAKTGPRERALLL